MPYGGQERVVLAGVAGDLAQVLDVNTTAVSRLVVAALRSRVQNRAGWLQLLDLSDRGGGGGAGQRDTESASVSGHQDRGRSDQQVIELQGLELYDMGSGT